MTDDPSGIYLDYAATAPLLPEVHDAMAPYLHERFGNPGAPYRLGREARKALDTARARVAACLAAEPREIIFTSGATEANNLAIFGALGAAQGHPRRIAVSAIEHPSVMNAAKAFAGGFSAKFDVIPVDEEGRLHAAEVEKNLTEDTVMLAVMYGNNETGVLQSVESIGEHCRERGIHFHVDAVQAAATTMLDPRRIHADTLAISAHKIGGPKGIGALYLRHGARIAALIRGGPQERGRRGGTENVPAIAGFGEACKIAAHEHLRNSTRFAALRGRLEAALLDQIPESWINGPKENRLPHILNIGFGGIDGEQLLYALDNEGIAVSTGAACASGSLDPSHVLLAMGQPHERAQRAIRISVGHATTDRDIDTAIETIPRIVAQLRKENAQ